MNKRKADWTVQEYRSHLFSRMFDRYVSQRHFEGIYNQVTVVEGVAERYYFHVIAREEHLHFADAIGENIHAGFDKPE